MYCVQKYVPEKNGPEKNGPEKYIPNPFYIEAATFEAVKRYREKHNCSLSEAKDAIYKLLYIKKIIVTNIDWDTDDEKVDLPTELEIEINEDNADLLVDIDRNADNLLNYLSNTYGYCIYGFHVETE